MDKRLLLFLIILGGAFMLFVPWSLPAAGRQYQSMFDGATKKYSLPKNLLARVAYQESRFRPDIISGEFPSSAGAQGIMQIIPRWHPGVDPLNPSEAIYYAASYLKKLYLRFGSWSEALAAYNWGPTNLAKYLSGDKSAIPKETQNYVNQIMTDTFRV